MDTTPGDTTPMTQSLRHLVDDAQQTLRDAAETGDARLDAMRHRFEAQLRRMRMQLDDLEEAAVHRARHAARSADLAVHNHPYSAMGAAAALGLLVGLLVARR